MFIRLTTDIARRGPEKGDIGEAFSFKAYTDGLVIFKVIFPGYSGFYQVGAEDCEPANG